jgi:bacterioferritin (cytochrome b1)
MRDDASLGKAEKLAKQKQHHMNKMGHASESDRRIMCLHCPDMQRHKYM